MMKKNTFFYFILILGLLNNIPTCQAQVGIGTDQPKGMLDIDSTIYGVVYPSVALTSTIIEGPVINPTAPNLTVGTTIYNTNTTNSGSNDVEPGIYSWNGSKWVTHFFIRQTELFKQTSVLRTSSNPVLGDYQDISGLGVSAGKSFTAKYSGLYRIELKVNFGGGEMIDNGDINTAMIEGDFKFSFMGTDHVFKVASFSTYNAHIGTGTYYSNVWAETYKTIYVQLVAGTNYPLSLQFDQYDAPGVKAGGNQVLTDDGRGYVGADIPSYIEISYIDEN